MFNNYVDFFTKTALMDAVAKQPFIPGQLAPLFETRQLDGTHFALEDQASQGGAVVAESPRGVPSDTQVLARNKVHTFDTEHHRQDAALYADEVLNARAVGANATGELIAQRRDRILSVLRSDMDTTLESKRMTCLLTPDNAFGSKPADAVVAFQIDATKTRAEIFTKIIKPMEDALGGIAFSGIDLYCSNGIWDDVIENKNIKDTYLLSLQAQAMRGDPREMFSWGGINFIRYRSSGSIAVTADKAIAVPRGVPGMFIQAFAPADTFSSVGVGSLGLPYYVQAYPIDGGDRGWRMEIQTNAKMVCTRPTAVLTIAMA